MSKYILERSNFLTGEIGRRYLGNTEETSYENALTLAKNVFILKSGGILRRPGTVSATSFVETTKERNYRVVPYVLSIDHVDSSGVVLGKAGETIGLVFSSLKAEAPRQTRTLVANSAFRRMRVSKAGVVFYDPSNTKIPSYSNPSSGDGLRLTHMIYPSRGDSPGNVVAATGTSTGGLTNRGLIRVEDCSFHQEGIDLFIQHKAIGGLKVSIPEPGKYIFSTDNFYSSPLNIPRKRTNIFNNDPSVENIMYVTSPNLFFYTTAGGARVKVTLPTGPVIQTSRDDSDPRYFLAKNDLMIGFARRMPIVANPDTLYYRTKTGSNFVRDTTRTYTIPSTAWVPSEFNVDLAVIQQNKLVALNELLRTKSLYFEITATSKPMDESTRSTRGFLVRTDLESFAHLSNEISGSSLTSNLKGFYYNIGQQKDTIPPISDNAKIDTIRRLSNSSLRAMKASMLWSFYDVSFIDGGYIKRGGPGSTRSIVNLAEEWVRLHVLKGRSQPVSVGTSGIHDGVMRVDFGNAMLGPNPSTDSNVGGMKASNGDFIINHMYCFAIPVYSWYTEEFYDGFIGEKNYPSVVSSYQQRLSYASTKNNSDSIWFSATDNLDVFQSRHFPQDAEGDVTGLGYTGETNIDDAFSFRVFSNTLNEIRWVSDDEDLILGLKNSQVLAKGYDDGKFGVGEVKVSNIDSQPSSRVPAVKAGRVIYFISADGKKLRSLGWSPQTRRLSTTDLSLRNDVLVGDDSFNSITYCDTRNMLLLTTREGKLFTYTILENAPLGAWARQEIGGNGFVEAVSVIPNSKDEWSDILLVVRRGDRVFYEFILRDYLKEDLNDFELPDSEYDAPYFLDGSTAFNRMVPSARPLSLTPFSFVVFQAPRGSLPHFNFFDPSMTALYNGKPRDVTLDTSRINYSDSSAYNFGGLDNPGRTGYQEKLIVGYPYESEAELSPLSLVVDRDGSATGSPKKIDTITFRVDSARQAEVGLRVRTEEGEVSEVSYPMRNAPVVGTDNIVKTYTGTEKIRIGADYSFDQRVFFKVTEPYPFTLLGVTIRGVVND